MNASEHSSDISLEKQVLSYLLYKDFYDRVKNIVTRDMFEGRLVTLFDTITLWTFIPVSWRHWSMTATLRCPSRQCLKSTK